MKKFHKIVLLIDADNTQLVKLENVIQEISTYGRIVVKRAYGNWSKETLKNWPSELNRLAIKAQQQFDYTPGKNTTDIALIIDAIDLLHKFTYDAFVIVASDSDYTPLSIYLKESGIYVMGVGVRQTVNAFRKSCDEFILLENLGGKTDLPMTADHQKALEDQTCDTGATEFCDHIDHIHDLLRFASDKYQNNDGYTNIATAGSYIKRTRSDFDVRTYGFSKLSKLIEAFPDRYVIKKNLVNGPSTIIEYQCK